MIYAVNMAQEGIIQLECLPSEIFKNTEEKADLNQPDSSTKTPHTLKIYFPLKMPRPQLSATLG